jgi:hypothetical protein
VRPYLLLALLLAPMLACGGGQTRTTGGRDTLTQRQRDSLLAQSGIPGAAGVGRAMRVADSVSARIRATDSVSP